MINPWMQLALDATRLAIESQQVIAIRTARIFGGDASENSRMVAEKFEAFGEAGFAIAAASATGLSGAAVASDVIRRYRRRVRRNARRLTRAKS